MIRRAVVAGVLIQSLVVSSCSSSDSKDSKDTPTDNGHQNLNIEKDPHTQAEENSDTVEQTSEYPSPRMATSLPIAPTQMVLKPDLIKQLNANFYYVNSTKGLFLSPIFGEIVPKSEFVVSKISHPKGDFLRGGGKWRPIINNDLLNALRTEANDQQNRVRDALWTHTQLSGLPVVSTQDSIQCMRPASGGSVVCELYLERGRVPTNPFSELSFSGGEDPSQNLNVQVKFEMEWSSTILDAMQSDEFIGEPIQFEVQVLLDPEWGSTNHSLTVDSVLLKQLLNDLYEGDCNHGCGEEQLMEALKDSRIFSFTPKPADPAIALKRAFSELSHLWFDKVMLKLPGKTPQPIYVLKQKRITAHLSQKIEIPSGDNAAVQRFYFGLK